MISFVVVLGVLGGITYAATKPSTIEYITPEEVIVEKEVTIPEIQKREQDALTASSTEIQKAMEKAAQDAKNAMETEIKLNVNRTLQAELQEQELALEEKVSL